MRRCAGAIAVAAVVSTMLPAVAAPDPTAPAATATFAETPDRIAPLDEPTQVPMTVTYDCSRQHPTEPTRITVALVDRPGWLTAIPNVSTVVDRVDRTTCAEHDHRRTVRVNWSLAAGADAPARRPANLTVEATVRLADGDHTARATVPVEAAFYGAVSRKGPTVARAAAGETAELELTVRNRGNGPVRIEIDARDVDDGLQIDTPEPGVAPAPWQDAPSTWNGTIALTGTDAGSIYEATVALVPRYAKDPTVAGDTLAYRVRLRTDALPAEGELPPGVVAVPAYTSGLGVTLGVGVAVIRRLG